jgi:hypothetical protein
LDDVLGKLEAAIATENDDEWWQQCLLALELLHMLDDAAIGIASSPKQYRATRDSSSGGQTLAALTWFRGAVHHQREEMKALFLRRRVSDRWDGEKLVRQTVEGWNGEKLAPVKTEALNVGWPPRSSITPSTQPAHGRDLLYDQHIAEQPILAPLRDAQAFLVSYF